MIWTSVISALLIVPLSQAATTIETSPAGLHMVIEREFNFLAATNTLRFEQWVAADKTYEKRGNQVSITRKDLGVRWVMDAVQKTYTERSLTESESNQPAPKKPDSAPGDSKVAPDLRLEGFRYEPVFDWAVRDTGETATMNGCSCTKVDAAGEADYAETKLVLWLCQRNEAGAKGDPNAALLNQIRNDSTRSFAAGQLANRGNLLLMSIEETTEPAISPTMVTRIRVRTFEMAPIPAGLFDLPAGLQKVTRSK